MLPPLPPPPPVPPVVPVEVPQGGPSPAAPSDSIPPEHLTSFQAELWRKREDAWYLTESAKREYKWHQDKDGLWRTSKGKLVILPGPLRIEVLEACHDSVYSGHFGRLKTENLISRMFYWPYLSQDTLKYVKSCDICERVKATNKAPLGGLQPLPVPSGKWSDVTVDMITDLPPSAEGYDAILVFVDRLTKMTHFVPTHKTLDSVGFCQLLMANVCRLHGWPRRLVSDRGSIFLSHFTNAVAYIQGFCKDHSSAFHPESDGQTERMNRVLEEVLRSFCSCRQSTWAQHLPMAEFAINNSVNEATHTTPFLLNYGVNPRHPDIMKLVEPVVEQVLLMVKAVPADQANANNIVNRVVRIAVARANQNCTSGRAGGVSKCSIMGIHIQRGPSRNPVHI